MPLAPVRILVVDDFAPWRRSVRSLLKTHAELQVVGEGADGLEAVQKASELKPDLILLDIGLPGLNGIEAAKQIRQLVPDTRILFVTLNSDPDVARAALDTGAKGYVLKADAGMNFGLPSKRLLGATSSSAAGWFSWPLSHHCFPDCLVLFGLCHKTRLHCCFALC